MRRDEFFSVYLPRDLTGAHKRRVEMRFFPGKAGAATERARVLTRVIRNARIVEEPDVRLGDDLVQRVIARGEIKTPSGLVPVHCYAFVEPDGRTLPFGVWRADDYKDCATCIAENINDEEE